MDPPELFVHLWLGVMYYLWRWAPESTHGPLRERPEWQARQGKEGSQRHNHLFCGGGWGMGGDR